MLREYLKSLADKFRTYLGGEPTDLINAQDFTLAIDDVYEAGKQSVNTDEIFQDGSDDFANAIWTVINGTYSSGQIVHKDWTRAFAYWKANEATSKRIFRPHRDIEPTIAANMFMACEMKFDLQEQLDNLGVKIDFSNCTNFALCFYATSITRVGIIDLTKASASGIQRMFEGSSIVTIEELIFNESTAYNYSGMFANQTKLENINKISGKITQNKFDVSTCTKLTHDSLMNIINTLKEYTDGSTHTVTLGTTNLAKLTDEEKAVATEKGWTLL